jgi:NitT/TauT family transport system substrate-binding protein
MITRRLFTLALTAAVAFAASPGSFAQQRKLTVVMPFAAGISFYPVYVAAEKGFFKEENLDVQIVVANDPSAAIQQLSTGNADVAVSTPGSMMIAVERGAKLKSVYITYQNSPFRLTVPEESSIKTLAALKGKTVGVPSLSVGSDLARAMLEEVGLDKNSYKVLEVGRAATALLALKNGAVDAYVAGPSDRIGLAHRGQKLRDLTPPKYQSLFDDPVIFQTQFIEKNPKIVAAIGRALAKASVWSAVAPDSAIELIGRRFPGEIQNREYAQRLMAEMLRLYTLPATADGKWGYNDPAGWQLTMEVLVKGGNLKAPLNVKELFTNEFLDAFNAFDAKAVQSNATQSKK